MLVLTLHARRKKERCPASKEMDACMVNGQRTNGSGKHRMSTIPPPPNTPPPRWHLLCFGGMSYRTKQAAARGVGKRKGKEASHKKKRGRGGNAAPGFYELNDEEDAATAAVGLGGDKDKQAQAQRRR